jgi:hypothetical protein
MATLMRNGIDLSAAMELCSDRSGASGVLGDRADQSASSELRKAHEQSSLAALSSDARRQRERQRKPASCG